jgi:hypothetical protein
MEESLKQLGDADVVAFGGVGFAGTLLPVTVAFRALAEEVNRRGEELRPRLLQLLATATPAGKVYAAALLGRIEPAAGRDAWQRLARDPSPINTFTGCMRGQQTLASYAAEQLAATGSD